MPVRRRLTALFGCLLLLTAVSALIARSTLAERDAAFRQLQERAEPARSRLADLQASLVDQETGVRGFVITADEAFLEPYEQGRVRSDRLLLELGNLLDDDELALQAELADVEAALTRWREQVAEPEIALTRDGGAGAAAQLVRAARGRMLFDQLRAEVEQVRSRVSVRQQVAQERADAARRQVTRALEFSVAGSAVLLMVAAALVRQWLTRPLDQLTSGVRGVASGALHTPVRVDGPSDLVSLGRDVDDMRRRIVGDLDAAVAAREALEQQAPAVALLWDRLRATDLDEAVVPAGVEVAAALHPAEGVLAGDWYDLIDVGGGVVAVAVVDVSGHGTAAGALALASKQLLGAALRDGRDPGDALAWLAHHLGDTGEAFLTAFVAVVDTASGRGWYANAGHPPAMVVGRGGTVPCPETGPLLGPFRGEWESRRLELGPGDTLFTYTDALLETRTADGEEFGEQRVLALLADERGGDARRLVDTAVDAVRGFRAGRLADDLTVLALVWKGPSSAPAEAGPRLVTSAGSPSWQS